MNLEYVTLKASKEPILSKKEFELCYKNAFSFDQVNYQYSTFDEPLEPIGLVAGQRDSFDMMI